MEVSLTGTSAEGPFVDGVVDIQSDVHHLLDGPRVVRDERGVTIMRMADVLAVTKRRRAFDGAGDGRLAGRYWEQGALIPLMLDGDAHKYRKLLDPLFAGR